MKFELRQASAANFKRNATLGDAAAPAVTRLALASELWSHCREHQAL